MVEQSDFGETIGESKMRKQTDYPVGARWEAYLWGGINGTVWLQERKENLEIWRYSYSYRDGSGKESGLYNNRADCVAECAAAMRVMYGLPNAPKVRFIRVKEEK